MRTISESSHGSERPISSPVRATPIISGPMLAMSLSGLARADIQRQLLESQSHGPTLVTVIADRIGTKLRKLVVGMATTGTVRREDAQHDIGVLAHLVADDVLEDLSGISQSEDEGMLTEKVHLIATEVAERELNSFAVNDLISIMHKRFELAQVPPHLRDAVSAMQEHEMYTSDMPRPVDPVQFDSNSEIDSSMTSVDMPVLRFNRAHPQPNISDSVDVIAA